MRAHGEFAKDSKLCVIVIVQYAKAIFQTEGFGGIVQALKQKLVVRQWGIAFAMLGDIGFFVKPEVIALHMHIGVKTLIGIFVDEKRQVIRVFFPQILVGFEKRLAAAPRIQRGEMVDFVADFRVLIFLFGVSKPNVSRRIFKDLDDGFKGLKHARSPRVCYFDYIDGGVKGAYVQ